MTASYETVERTAQLHWLLEQAHQEATRLHVKAPHRCTMEHLHSIRRVRDDMHSHRLADLAAQDSP